MRDVHITVEIEWRRSDGNYGSDRAMCQLSATCDAADEAEVVVGQLLDQAEGSVYERLAHSTSLAVRRSVQRAPRLCNECKEPLSDDEDYLHPACEQQLLERRKREEDERRAKWEADRAERQAEYQRERELAGVGASTDEEDDEDLPL